MISTVEAYARLRENDGARSQDVTDEDFEAMLESIRSLGLDDVRV